MVNSLADMKIPQDSHSPTPIAVPANSLQKFDLIANAKDSLAHIVSHLASPATETPNPWKIAIREASHVLELFLKEKLQRLHPCLILEDIDKYPSKDPRTIGFQQATHRLQKIAGVKLADEDLTTIEAARKLRNDIEHYEFHLDEKAARANIGRLLSFIFTFTRDHLALDLEADYKKDGHWKNLLDMTEFWKVHKTAVEKRQADDEADTLECSACYAETFDRDTECCGLCGHHEQPIECGLCFDSVYEAETQEITVDADGPKALCGKCVERIRGEQEYEANRDYYRSR